MIARYHKHKRYWSALVHGHKTDSGVELKVVFGEGGLLTSRINSAYPSYQLGDS